MKHLNNILIVVLAGGLSFSSAAAEAQESKLENERQLVQRLLVCRALDSAVERLDCFDKLTRTLDQQSIESGAEAREAAQLRTAETRERAAQRREEAQQRAEQAREAAASRRQQTTADDFGREHRPQESELEAQVYIDIEEAWQNPRGLWRFRLTSGAEWHQVQAERFVYSEDNNYYIERAALNSFLLGWDGSNRNIRVRRVD